MEDGCDVLIIGAGPAGASAAIALARSGYQVALIDKQRFPREKICGDFINPINWPLFEHLGVTQRILSEPHSEVSGFRITTGSGAAAETGFGSAPARRWFGLGLSRARLDQTLVERARELGASVRLGCRVLELSRTARGWRATLGSGEVLQAKLLIGADGRNSWVARQLSLEAFSLTQGRCVGFQARLRCSSFEPGKIEIHLFPGGYAGLVALGDGTVNLGLAIERSRLARHRVDDFLLTDCLSQNPRLKFILRRSDRVTELRSAYPVYFPARRCYADRALLVGDAARVTEPISGEGVYFAIQSGLLAALALDRALRAGDLSARHFARYERACARAFRGRTILNALLRLAIYRPALLEPLVRCSQRNGRMLSSLVDRICRPRAVP